MVALAHELIYYSCDIGPVRNWGPYICAHVEGHVHKLDFHNKIQVSYVLKARRKCKA